MSYLSNVEEVRSGIVKYETLKTIRSVSTFPIDDLPFLKRVGFADEREFRIVYTSKKQGVDYPRLPFEYDAINSIFVGPWLHKDYFEDVKQALHQAGLPEKTKVTQSTLIGNRIWQDFAAKAK